MDRFVFDDSLRTELVGAECTERVEDAVSGAVYGLVDYATEHFADEEALMEHDREFTEWLASHPAL